MPKEGTEFGIDFDNPLGENEGTSDALKAASLINRGDDLLFALDQECEIKFREALEINKRQDSGVGIVLVMERMMAWRYFTYVLAEISKVETAIVDAKREIVEFGLERLRVFKGVISNDAHREEQNFQAGLKLILEGDYEGAERELVGNLTIHPGAPLVWLCYCAARKGYDPFAIHDMLSLPKLWEGKYLTSRDEMYSCMADFCFALAWIASAEHGSMRGALVDFMEGKEVFVMGGKSSLTDELKPFTKKIKESMKA